LPRLCRCSAANHGQAIDGTQEGNVPRYPILQSEDLQKCSSVQQGFSPRMATARVLDEESKSVVETQVQHAPPSPEEAEPTSYTQREKWTIVVIAALAALFSPLPANIYFPAIPELAKDFHRSIEDINLTVTIYLVFQGVCKPLWTTAFFMVFPVDNG
jgi:hypothetical protein